MINIKENEQLNTLNHSCAHLLAHAVKHLYPNSLFWVGPVIEEVSENHKDVFFGKVNVDNEEELAMLFKVTSIPLVVKIKNKKVVESFVGTKGRAFLEEFFGK